MNDKYDVIKKRDSNKCTRRLTQWFPNVVTIKLL